MIHLLDKDGKIVRKFFHTTNLVTWSKREDRERMVRLALDRIGPTKTQGKLCILFDNKNSLEVNFQNFHVMGNFVRKWLSTDKATVFYDGQDLPNSNYIPIWRYR